MSDSINPLTTVRAALAVASKATPGPWWHDASDSTKPIMAAKYIEVAGGSTPVGLGGDPAIEWNRDADPLAIVALRNATDAIAAVCDELERVRALVSSYESPTCDHRHPCRCGSGGHPRRCERHPLAYDRHIAELNAIGVEESRIDDQAARIATLEAELAQAKAPRVATVGGLTSVEADALLCRWYRAKCAAIEAFVDLENLRRPDPSDSWGGGIGQHDPLPGAEKRAADTKNRLDAIASEVIAVMTRGPIGEG